MTRAENPIEALRAMLDAGAAIIDGVLADPLLARWMDAFTIMPAADRPVIVGAVEREVQVRVMNRAVKGPTAQTLHANPNSRLYLRVHGQELQADDMRHEDMMVAMGRALRVIHMIAGTPRVHAEWVDATRAALAQLDDERRASVARVLGELLALVDGTAVTTGRT